ncbi:Uncharacterized protein BM_BM1017 [Brugia malayi]|uniref:Bm1017 n=1 Tax=Brugia malayi TaxID=6279 RepID=A0A0K0IMA4_BRUMA|nr:Uncharacterized protein BM_BM1017 [Brugia malayi]CTP81682.1 Bm1017 [Brugia malayi]VIO96165.1 Uncharacterized protein BM_BM1017 [Brugia malayi]
MPPPRKQEQSINEKLADLDGRKTRPRSSCRYRLPCLHLLLLSDSYVISLVKKRKNATQKLLIFNGKFSGQCNYSSEESEYRYGKSMFCHRRIQKWE